MRIKPKALLTVSAVFYIWYAAAGILLNCTPWDYTLTGAAWHIYNFCTHFYIDLEAFSALHIVWMPIAFFVYTGLVLLLYEPFTKKQKIWFGIMPVAALLINIAAMAVVAALE